MHLSSAYLEPERDVAASFTSILSQMLDTVSLQQVSDESIGTNLATEVLQGPPATDNVKRITP